MIQQNFKRRRVISLGLKTLALSAFASLACWGNRAAAQAIEWKSLLRRKPRGGKGEVLSIKGVFRAGLKKLRKGSVIKSGVRITSKEAGELFLRLSDNTTVQLKGPLDMRFNIDGKKRGILSLTRGAILAVIPTRQRYLVEGPTATLGIKGTVFYREVIHGNPDKMNRDIKNRPVKVPADAKDYFCLCNGKADYLNSKTAIGTLSEDASKVPHHSRFLKSELKSGIVDAGVVINHDDRDIKRLIDLQKKPQHHSDFLKL